jgi:hypothetical protein
VVGNKEGILAELQAMGVTGNLEKMAEQLAENVEDLRKFGEELNANE